MRRLLYDIERYQMKYKSLLIRVPPDIHDALTRLRTERHVNTSAWVRATIKNALESEGGLLDTPVAPTIPAPPAVLEAPLQGWRPHRLDNGDWGSIYCGDISALPSELVGAHITVQLKNGQGWNTTVTAVLERSSEQVVVTDSGRPDGTLISGAQQKA